MVDSKSNNEQLVYCPYIKVPNKYKDTLSVLQNTTMCGDALNDQILPNLSYAHYVPGFGKNVCQDNKPVHINFINGNKSECYADAMGNKLDYCKSV